MPKGFEEIAFAMDTDTVLRDSLFKRCKAFMFAGAGLSQAVWNTLTAHGEAAEGERVRIVTGLGMTETAPACTFAVGTDVRSGQIGLPVPGAEVKLVKDAATGDRGFYRTGDAGRLVDPADVNRGLFFDGRTAEDFKLSSGTFVSMGPLRAIDKGEVTDKGSINQRAVLAHRDSLAQTLYEGREADPLLILPNRS